MPRPFGPPSSHIRSRDYASAVRSKPLDDATIEKYIRAGRYGEEKRKALEERDAEKKGRKVRKRASTKHIQNLLAEILSS